MNVFLVLDLVILTGLFLLGAAGIPALIYFLGPGMPMFLRNAVGKLNFILAAVGNGRTVAYRDKTGSTHYLPAREDAIYWQGEWLELDDSIHWEHLGLKPFGIAYEKSREVFGEVLADLDEMGDLETVKASDGTSLAVVVDNPAKLDALVTEHHDDSDVDTSPGTGWLIDRATLAQKLKQSNGVRKIFESQQHALTKYGGDSDLGVMAWSLAIGLFALMGYMLVWWNLS